MAISTYSYNNAEAVVDGIDFFTVLNSWGKASVGYVKDAEALLSCRELVLRLLKESVQEGEKPRLELLNKELCKGRVKLIVRITCWVIAGIMAIAAFGFAFIYLLGVIPSGGVALACGAGLGALLAAAAAGGPAFGASFLLNIDCKSKALKKECVEKQKQIEGALKEYEELSRKADQRINDVDEITALFGRFNAQADFIKSGLTEVEVKVKFIKAIKKARSEVFYDGRDKVYLPGKVSVVVTPFLNRVFVGGSGSGAFGIAGGVEVEDLDALFIEKKG
jgi:hypothetical protein